MEDEPDSRSLAKTKCRICGYENPSDLKYCGNCGSRLVVEAEKKITTVVPNKVKCDSCGSQNPASLKFCGNCGSKLPVEEAVEEAVEEESVTSSGTVKCGNCGFQNPGNLKYCGNCGAKIRSAWRGSEFMATRYEALALLHFTGSLYLLVSILFNALVQASYLFLVPYIVSMLLGFYAGYEYQAGKTTRSTIAASVTALLVGLIATFLLFLIGLEVRGVVGPGWVIFALNLWFLQKIRGRLGTSSAQAKE